MGHSLVDDLKEYAEGYYTDEEFQSKCKQYDYATPFTKESLLYRELFEKYYPGQAHMIAGFWMPTRSGKAATWTIPPPVSCPTTVPAASDKQANSAPKNRTI